MFKEEGEMATIDDQSARAQLLKVTTELLLTHVPEEITVRQIAAQAGVNAAAVNYYFHSKEQLIDEAVLTATATAFGQGLAVLTNKAVKPRERLVGFFEGYAKGLVEFKGITRTAFRSFLLRPQGSDHYTAFLKRLLEATVEVFRELGQRPETAGKKALVLYSGVAFPFLALRALQSMSAVDYADAAARREYVRFLVDALIDRKE
jgi:AcrR family transcriptional regulator